MKAISNLTGQSFTRVRIAFLSILLLSSNFIKIKRFSSFFRSLTIVDQRLLHKRCNITIHFIRSLPVQRSCLLSLFRSFSCPLIVTVLSLVSYRKRKVICGQLLLILRKNSENWKRVCFVGGYKKKWNATIVNNGVKLVNALGKKGEKLTDGETIEINCPRHGTHTRQSYEKIAASRIEKKQTRRSSRNHWVTFLFLVYFGGIHNTMM